MNTVFFFPFLFIVVVVVAAMLLLPFWFKARFSKYLQSYSSNNVYAVILVIFGAILSVVSLLGWAVSFLDLLQTTSSFDPTGNWLHDWSFSFYGYLYFYRWSVLVVVLLLFGTGFYFWLTGRKSGNG